MKLNVLTSKTTGFILYEGPSLLDGKPIVCIATGLKKSNNSKTGNMIQCWILCKNKNPIEAMHSGNDETICGDCKHRRHTGGSCYVNLGQAPLNIYKSYRKGNYPKYDPKEHSHYFKGRTVRLGAYGEPVAVPLKIWKPILAVVKGHTAYTHQWQNPKIEKGWNKYAMASVDSVKEWKSAQKKNWRTFRVKTQDDTSIQKHEFVCPASEEMGKRTTCEKCLACCGGHPPKGSVVITVHGSIKKRFNEYAK